MSSPSGHNFFSTNPWPHPTSNSLPSQSSHLRIHGLPLKPPRPISFDFISAAPSSPSPDPASGRLPLPSPESGRPPPSSSPRNPWSPIPMESNSSAASVLCASFNQDIGFIAIGTKDGFKIFDASNGRPCYERAIGAFSIVDMLFSSSLLAIVGAGEQPLLSPRRLCLFNTVTGIALRELNFLTSILAIHINRKSFRCCAGPTLSRVVSPLTG